MELEDAVLRNFFRAAKFRLSPMGSPKPFGAIEGEAFLKLLPSQSWDEMGKPLSAADFNPLDPDHPENELHLLDLTAVHP